MWMEYQKVLDSVIYIPKFTEKLFTSYVDVIDVGDVLQTILTTKIPVRNKIFNIASHQPMKLGDLLNVIKNAGEFFDAKIEITENNFVGPSISDSPTGALKICGDFYFPSVTRGPIDIRKIQTELNWRSRSNFQNRAKQIAEFYKNAWTEFPDQRKLVGESLLTDLCDRVTVENKERFRRLLNS